MRVGIDITPLQTGHRYRGIGTYVHHLVKELISLGDENQYVLFALKGAGEHSGFEKRDAPNVEYRWLPSLSVNRARHFVSHQVVLPYYLVRSSCDLFHFTSLTTNPWVPALPWHCPVPLVVTIHDLIPLVIPELMPISRHARVFYRWQLYLASNADHIVTDSENSRQDIIRLIGVQPERVSSIHLAVDMGRRSTVQIGELPQGVRKPYILHVGGGYPNKNARTLIRAFKLFKAMQASDFSMVLVGEGYDKAELGSCESVGLEISILSRLDRTQLISLYENAAVFVFPSISEGFGLPPLEAMQYGIPVIAANASCIPEVLGSAARYFPPFDAEKLCQEIRKVTSKPDLAMDLVEKGYRRVSNFSWRNTAEQTAYVYQRTLSNLKKRRGHIA